MGLYLCIFTGDEEFDGVEVGSYDDFHFLRQTVQAKLENGVAGARYPVLMLHSDCDGEWAVDECSRLEKELLDIVEHFKQLAPEGFHADWQTQVARQLGLVPRTLCDCFIDVDGEPLIERMLALCRKARSAGMPIRFQ